MINAVSASIYGLDLALFCQGTPAFVPPRPVSYTSMWRTLTAEGCDDQLLQLDTFFGSVRVGESPFNLRWHRYTTDMFMIGLLAEMTTREMKD